MNNDYTITEDCTLPSLGKVYQSKVNSDLKIRSMTTQDEMKRLSYSDRPYKMLSEIIDDCLIEKPGISAYDMCLKDYEYLLHRLRIATYGQEYKISTVCPVCGNINNDTIDLETLDISQYSDNCDQYLNIILPMSKKQIKLRLQTPRMLDDISAKSKELKAKLSDIKGDPAFLLQLESIIETVDGEILNPAQLATFVRQLPMRDTNYILKSIDKINFGVNTKLNITCHKCKADYNPYLPITGEFFGPSID